MKAPDRLGFKRFCFKRFLKQVLFQTGFAPTGLVECIPRQAATPRQTATATSRQAAKSEGVAELRIPKVFRKEKEKEERTKRKFKKRCCRAEATNAVILALKTNIGDGRQRAKKRICNKTIQNSKLIRIEGARMIFGWQFKKGTGLIELN